MPKTLLASAFTGVAFCAAAGGIPSDFKDNSTHIVIAQAHQRVFGSIDENDDGMLSESELKGTQ